MPPSHKPSVICARRTRYLALRCTTHTHTYLKQGQPRPRVPPTPTRTARALRPSRPAALLLPQRSPALWPRSRSGRCGQRTPHPRTPPPGPAGTFDPPGAAHSAACRLLSGTGPGRCGSEGPRPDRSLPPGPAALGAGSTPPIPTTPTAVPSLSPALPTGHRPHAPT